MSPDAINQTLKTIFWQELRDETIRNAIRNKYEVIWSFDEVIKNVRITERETRECRAHMAEEAKKDKPLRKPAQTHQQAPAVPQNGNAQGGDFLMPLLL
ncbi:hypothetical protein HOLleu_14138 [Holothuria leucospilota]|uniref:Uncharacterized protein n=1 Tax=Holothuria leucospilota TaxID=206669 RepID=A0A9Q1C7R4_HOLLE|nr:hypothetical protein HOLleu_14138 [Holothuria leucospilota]